MNMDIEESRVSQSQNKLSLEVKFGEINNSSQVAFPSTATIIIQLNIQQAISISKTHLTRSSLVLIQLPPVLLQQRPFQFPLHKAILVQQLKQKYLIEVDFWFNI